MRMTTEESLNNLARYRNDPWEFLKDCVYTLDQADTKNPVKKFPVDLMYIYLYVRLWQQYPRIAVPKSRRMIMSWTNIALFTWDALFHGGRNLALVSRKEEAADELVQRARFIVEHIPKDKIPSHLLPDVHYKFCNLIFDFGNGLRSLIQGFPQGADQLRQFTFSRIMGDEMAFWESAQKMYAASMPTLDGGGQFVGISSRAPGFFKALCHDQIETASDGNFAIEALADYREATKFPPIEGVEVWINKRNRFLIFELHYTANPEKRSTEYREHIRSQMPYQQYMQEYEKQWDSYAGLPVYPDFDVLVHGSKERIRPHIGLPLLRGWDFGLTPACIVAQLVGDQLLVLWEHAIQGTTMGAERFVPMVLSECKVKFSAWGDLRKDWIDYGDASGAFRKDTDEGTCFGVMAANGLAPKPSKIAWEARKGSVEHFILKRSKDGAALLVDMNECPILLRGLKGGYRYPEKNEVIEPDKIRPLKDIHSHIQDALQSITSNVVSVNKRKGFDIPVPSYRWSRENTKVEITA